MGDKEHRLAAGMDAYVSNPHNPKELFAAIEDAVLNPKKINETESA